MISSSIVILNFGLEGKLDGVLSERFWRGGHMKAKAECLNGDGK